MSIQAAAIEALSIGKDFGDFTALDAVSMRIEPGEFVTLLGPSGSGKTTFLMILAGFVDATRGKLLVEGIDRSNSPAEARGFGMVFQGYALFPHMSVEDNIAFPLKVQKRSAAQIRARVAEMIEMVGLSGHGHKKPSGLSGGQQQRVALARALAYEPPVLLLDEPFSALDKNLRGQMQDELRRIHRQMGTSFVFVTHDQSEALALSSRVAIFEAGRLQQMGAPQQVYDRPANRFVAEFLGDINIFPAAFSGAQAQVAGQALALSEAAPKGAAHLAVRPEHMKLLTAPQPGAIACRVSDRVYMGAVTRLQLDTDPAGTPVVMDMPTAQLPDLAEPGRQIWVSWDRADSLVF
ncbi:ABC transporter ATP-binding protein [Pseudooceanicola algae]|uniref:Sulfate/thiosulfate import ATP-binding protein CysA n=1 Tax=Pseudooceanicola algae TaxID=1537215 RepID=A0A418SI37_9RHOB|nr:ABC transporter ATP-binding protein [Pseudooceanicola algae]QPM90291.1 Sulfate/thiosulfate import ATP-binding protein CysA [Pseudooceanicola algae]